MKLALPSAVENYLKTLPRDARKMAYLRLGSDMCVDISGGQLKQCEVDSLDKTVPIDEQIDSLVGLLPIKKPTLIIENATNGKSRYLDLHLFTEHGQQWIVLFDNTEAAVELQARQQERLVSDINEERKYRVKNNI